VRSTQFPNVMSAHTAYGDYLLAKKDTAGAEKQFIAGAGPNNDQLDALARLGQLYANQISCPRRSRPSNASRRSRRTTRARTCCSALRTRRTSS